MAASSTAQPPGVVKTLTDDKKRKRPVKKRRGKKLTVAESEAESEAQAEAEAEAEAEAARSSKRRVDDVMGVGEDPVGEDGMDIDAPAWPPAGVEPAMRA
eukprot:jgi/Tetstr1/457572/TSEL_044140.t1